MKLKENMGPVAIVIGVVAILGVITFMVIQANKPAETNPDVVGKPPAYAQGGDYKPGGMGR